MVLPVPRIHECISFLLRVHFILFSLLAVAASVILGRIHLRSDEAKDVRWMSWFDHGVKWDQQWHFEYAATMFMAWSAGENIFRTQTPSSENTAESEVYSVKSLRWQAWLSQFKTQNQFNW